MLRLCVGQVVQVVDPLTTQLVALEQQKEEEESGEEEDDGGDGQRGGGLRAQRVVVRVSAVDRGPGGGGGGGGGRERRVEEGEREDVRDLAEAVEEVEGEAIGYGPGLMRGQRTYRGREVVGRSA